MKQSQNASKVLWVILLDHSGSMGEPFARRSEFQGYTETGDYKIKLDAAKDSLFKQIYGFGVKSDVAVIAFTGTPTLLFKCSTQVIQENRTKIDELKPEDSTDIANAISFAHEQLSQWKQYNVSLFVENLF